MRGSIPEGRRICGPLRNDNGLGHATIEVYAERQLAQAQVLPTGSAVATETAVDVRLYRDEVALLGLDNVASHCVNVACELVPQHDWRATRE